MNKRYIQILIFLGLILLFSPKRAVAQEQKKDNTITIESLVKDEDGILISDAIIYGNEGEVVAKTDASGRFAISVSDQTDLLIVSDGYEPATYKPGEYKNLEEFILKASFYSEMDEINIAFGKTKRGDLVNSVNVLNPTDILQYDNTQGVNGVLTGRILGLLGSSNIRGIGNALFIVDGLPRNINTINLEEVDQITVLKDVNSSILYGNLGYNGVVLVTTKRGQANKKQVNVTGFYGISKPTELPKYLPSADYMELYNEARVNDGLKPQYDLALIEKYRSGNPYRYPNIDYYSDKNLKSFKPFSKINTEFSGGNEVATYYTNIGWDHTGSLLNVGAGKTAQENRFNVRGNVDVKVNDWINSTLDAFAVFNNNIGPVGDYWNEASTRHPNLFSPLIPISLIDPENSLLNSRKNDVDGIYILGGTQNYLGNTFADAYSGGENENVQRTFSFNNKIDFDLNKVVKGLKFHTNISFDFYTQYDQFTRNSYSVYQPTWDESNDLVIDLTQYGSDVRTGTQNVDNSYYERRIGFYGMFDYDRTFGEVNHITGSLLGFGNLTKSQYDLQGNKNLNLGLRLGYRYKKKYMVDFSNAYVNSVKLPTGSRTVISPSLGLAWVISSEDFMSAVSAVDYLKFKLTGGIMNVDTGIDGFYYYDNVYRSSGYYRWQDGSWAGSGTISSYGGNNQLSFEKRNELNLGFESVLFNSKVSLEANVFTNVYSGQLAQPITIYPSFYTDFIPYENFGKTSYRGAELGLSYNQSLGDISFVFGANALYTTSEVLKRDEIYNDQYRYRTGRPIDAIFGLVDDGFFSDQTEIDNHEIQAFGEVKPGDIKYVDQNNDGIIDNNDEVQIGRWQAPFTYGLHLKVSYKNFTLFTKGTGRIGADSNISGGYYWVDGNDKYSDYVLNRWTEETKTTATFPRLSSMTNNNNFRQSTFWLYRDNYFTLDRLQLTYDMPEIITGKLFMKKLSVFIDASNLLLVSKHRAVRELRVGSEPYYRSFSIGLKTMF